MSDLISREEAVEAIKNEMLSWLEGDLHDYRKVVDAIIDLPTVDAVPVRHAKWIPASERLPDHDECIKNNRLFNVSDGNRSYSEWFDYDRQKFGEHTMAGFRVDYAVIAWMPLPEPYEVEDE